MKVNGLDGQEYKVTFEKTLGGSIAYFFPLGFETEAVFEMFVEEERLKTFKTLLKTYSIEPRTRKLEN